MGITTEHESAGDNDDYQGVSDSTMVNAELDALLDPDSDTDNPTQQQNPQQTSESEQEGTGKPEKRKTMWRKGTRLLQRTEHWQKHKKTPESEREKDNLNKKKTQNKKSKSTDYNKT